MTTLAADSPRVHHISQLDHFAELPVAASDIIYEGAAVGINSSGYAAPLLTSGFTTFVGFAVEKVDNSTGANGDKRVKLIVEGKYELTVGSTTIADVEEPVFASDDDTFTKTKGASTIRIGTIEAVHTAGSPVVHFKGAKPETSIAAPSGGATQDAEARTAITSILAALEQQGILDPS